MALGAYQAESTRGSVLNALAHPAVVNPVADISSAVQAARGIQDLRTSQFTLQQAQLQPAYQAMRQIMATNPNPTWDDVNNALAQSARIGGNIDGLVANATETMGRGGKPGDFVRAYALGGMSPENQAQFGVGIPATVDTGGNIVFGTRGGVLSAAPGQFTGATSIQKGFTPSEASDFIAVPDVDANGRPTGTTHLVPRGTVFGTGVPGGGGGGAGGVGSPDGQGTSASAAVNNFGNIRAPGGGFASYATPQDGVAAITNNLTSYQDQYGINTLNGITARWAPKGDGANDPVAYANTISKLTGIDPNAKLDLHDPATLAKVIPAIAQVEHGRPMAVGGDVLNAGINAGLTGRPGGSVASGPAAPSGPFIGATSAQPVAAGSAVQPGGGGSPNVQPAGGMQYLDPTGRPIVQGGGGGGGAGGPVVQRAPGGGPILTPPAPWMGPLWEQSAKQYSADVDKEGGLAQRIQPWQSALSILKANPNLSTGPTSSQWNAWGTTLQQYGVSLPSMPGDALTAYQELGKNLARGLLNSGAGSPTDMARLEAEASSPNINMVRDAIQQLSARQIGYERFQVARLLYFRAQHPGEDPDQYANQYRSQTSQWFSKLDPVAFGADNMSDQDIASYMKGLSPAAQQNFRNSVREAAKLFPDFAKAGQ